MNRVVVAGEYRLVRGPDGFHYAESVFGRDFWDRYLEVFDEVLVVARVRAQNDVAGMTRMDGTGVSVFAMPHYVGFRGLIRAMPALRRRAKEVAALKEAVILRLPGAVGGLVASALPKGYPYAVEVVGDPADVFSKGVVEPPLRRLIRLKAITDLRRQCRRAATVAYVSRYQLADRYPANASTPTFAYSSATLPEEAFAAAPRTYRAPLRKLIGIGTMEQMYKGFDVLLEALALLRRSRPDVTLVLVGDGRYAVNLKRRVAELGLTDAVTFTGAFAEPADVRAELDAADLFVSSSRTEGLPRTVIEAQARGLAVVATRVGSTAELLAPESMCPPDDSDALAKLIAGVVDAPTRATRLAERGWHTSTRYAQAQLQAERNVMFRSLAVAMENGQPKAP